MNDSLVDFALKRLQEQLAQQLTPTQYEVRARCSQRGRMRLTLCLPLQRKFHFFNCFFFKKLLTDEPAMRCDSGAHAAGGVAS